MGVFYDHSGMRDLMLRITKDPAVSILEIQQV
jgi:hypothetical protein